MGEKVGMGRTLKNIDRSQGEEKFNSSILWIYRLAGSRKYGIYFQMNFSPWRPPHRESLFYTWYFRSREGKYFIQRSLTVIYKAVTPDWYSIVYWGIGSKGDLVLGVGGGWRGGCCACAGAGGDKGRRKVTAGEEKCRAVDEEGAVGERTKRWWKSFLTADRLLQGPEEFFKTSRLFIYFFLCVCSFFQAAHGGGWESVLRLFWWGGSAQNSSEWTKTSTWCIRVIPATTVIEL